MVLFCVTTLLVSVGAAASDSVVSKIIKSPNDKRSYLAFELENGLKALVISDPDTDRSAASMDVGVGSGDDPEGRQGLAHFLEHMLFLGTQKYPKAGEYQSYVSEHSGTHNAFTAMDRTNYFFDIDSTYLEPTLDRFSRFFIEPLFTPEYVQREKHAVHSEYQSKLKEDGRRGFAAFKQIINPEHPMAGFSVGSLETLEDRPGSNIRDELIQFYKQHYSADNMSLVVLGSQSPEELKQLVETKFSAIPRQSNQPEKKAAPLFEPGKLPAVLKIDSIKELHQLSLTFPVPAIRPHYEKKPLRYISALLGHEGPGSLLEQLKQQGLAKSLSAGAGLSNQHGATLAVQIGLTPEGFQRYQEVVDMTFQYLRLIRKSGVQSWIFDEEKLISDTAFRFKENGRKIYYVTHLASNLKRYPLEEVIRGDYLYKTYDPQLINSYLDYLTPENLLIELTAKGIPTNKTDPWYQTPYSFESLDQNLVKSWKRSEIDPGLRIPEPNPFLASDFELRKAIPSPMPEVLKSRPGYRLWFKQEQQFQTPKADFYFSFRSPVANDTARHHVLTSLFVRLVNDRLNSFTYPANVAGFKTHIYDHIRGFSVRLSGYRDKQSLLLIRIAETLKSLQVDPQRLAIFQTDLIRQLENSRKEKPYTLALDKIYRKVLKPQWSPDEQLQELKTITAQELQRFASELLSAGEVEALAHGDLLPEDALALSDTLESHLLKGVENAKVEEGQVILLPERVDVVDLDIEHNDSAISTYIQSADKTLKSRAQYALLAKILSPPFYNQLRTEKQLGYIVFATSMPILEHPGLALVVQSPSATPNQLQQHIGDFMDNSLTLISSVSEQQLEDYKQSLLVELLKKDQKLSDRTNRYWREIDRGYLQFNSREQLADAIREVSITDLVSAYQSLSDRQLIVRSAGQSLSSGLKQLPAPQS
ncbi:hypothetical protein BGP75_08000 [Motiliproteus sp. MSK22-1]|nr:hypothetical protein BGP75_08000 [Motiliproteus sp. MSK22-1]